MDPHSGIVLDRVCQRGSEIGSQLDAAAKARAIFEPIGADGILALLTRSMVDM